MASFGQLVAVLSLCLLVAVANSQVTPPPPPPIGNEICHHYTQGGTSNLDMPRTFDMLMIEFGRLIQTLNPMQSERWMREVDDDHDNRLSMAECVKLIQKIQSGIRRP